MTNQERAARLHGNGYNCCQAVLLTFCDELGVDPVTAFKIGEGFGLGMGGMENTCGALSGAIMLAGLKNSDGDLCSCPKCIDSAVQIVEEILGL